MAQQDLVPKTRFEKQIPYPILASIAEELKRLEREYPEQGIEVESQFDELDRITAELNIEAPYAVTTDDRTNLILLIAEAIRTIKYIDKNYI